MLNIIFIQIIDIYRFKYLLNYWIKKLYTIYECIYRISFNAKKKSKGKYILGKY